MDVIKLYDDYNVDYLTSGNTHCAPGWVQVHCPWCEGSQNYHLGYNLQNNFYTCYRCGWHPIPSTIAKLIHLSEKEAYTLIKRYGILVPSSYKEPIVKIRTKAHRLPSLTGPLLGNHKRYLESRSFDPDRLEREWNLVGTGPVSSLDNIDYKHRIIIPFIWNGQQVSFDSRDITGKDPQRYRACPKDRELIEHKSILYGRQDKWKRTGICVEGPTDVWRFGINSFGTSGIKYTPAQVRQMANAFKRIPVVFDDDPQAVLQANKLVSELKFRGIDSFRVDIKGDPGGMKQEDADYLVKQLIK